ncbi:PIN domain-containing protein [Thiocapsa bogorovii]|uniref:PIN domain-containing protein n=1 Tax=Thiocapsa bogorovii TaxID=521689 RepID=UPI001E5AA996|nr:PIN domain-containing protein [Thiocapsa bogorovii]UHD18088.1 PIN domain-containing protein [Thiocapsa bogorovii]
MSGEIRFLDTSILVYLFDGDEPTKQAIAERIFRDDSGIRLSTQVLAEFYVTVTRKLGRPMSPEQGLAAAQHFKTYPVAPITQDLVTRGISRSIDSRISFWDGLIVETALAEKARLLVTEDLQDGWTIGTMRVWNPFTPTGSDRPRPC